MKFKKPDTPREKLESLLLIVHGMLTMGLSKRQCADYLLQNGVTVFPSELGDAEQALEKQIPKEHHYTRVITVNDDIRESVCPSCLGVIATNKEQYPKYCPWCGQAIDWSDEND